MTAATQSVLDQMTASVIETKVKGGAKLTLVGTEATRITPAALPHTDASFPNDIPDEAILSRVSTIRELIDRIAEADRLIHVQWAAMLSALAAVETSLGHADQGAADAAEAATKQKELAADARARERAIEAAATLAASKAEAEEDVAEAIEAVNTLPQAEAQKVLDRLDAKAAAAQAATFGWECPVHHLSVEKVSRLGRTYRACNNADCKLFEKL